MKFIVDELPYYEEICPFWVMCPHNADDVCPRHWDKYKVTSDENPHECQFLIEQDIAKSNKNTSINDKESKDD